MLQHFIKHIHTLKHERLPIKQIQFNYTYRASYRVIRLYRILRNDTSSVYGMGFYVQQID